MSNKPSLERVPGSPPTLSETDLRTLSETYADVFAGEPWNEYTRCLQENTFYGRETAPGDSCAGCGAALTLAYPLDETIGNIRTELSRPDTAAWLLFGPAPARELGGFSWGFTYESPEAFVAAKYNTPAMRKAVVRALAEQGVTGPFYYLSESGIVDRSDLRGQGLSREFHGRRIECAVDLGLVAVQRTLCTGPMYRTSLRCGMRQIMGPEAVFETGVRRIVKTGRVVNDLVDSELADRVLFVRTLD
jgi:hypothetical protein